jgi:tetratricopeptide (TPR) repeat protein
LSLQPDEIDARIYMANMFTDTGQVEKAVPLLRQALKSNPNHAEVHWELGYAYRFAGMLQESVSECERARQIDPGVKLNSSALNIRTCILGSMTASWKVFRTRTMLG